MNIEHYIFRSYIALARAERYESDYPIEKAEADMKAGKPTLSALTWDEPERLTKKITEVRGLMADQQFQLGIVQVPTHLQNRLMCERLKEIYGLERVSKTPGFDEKGMFKIDRHKDFIFPAKHGKWITSLAQYSIREMEKWAQKRAA